MVGAGFLIVAQLAKRTLAAAGLNVQRSTFNRLKRCAE
jgi:hypothetical protein